MSAAQPANPHQTLEYRELEKLLQQAVSRLSNRQQKVYGLSRMEGLTHKEIADWREEVICQHPPVYAGAQSRVSQLHDD